MTINILHFKLCFMDKKNEQKQFNNKLFLRSSPQISALDIWTTCEGRMQNITTDVIEYTKWYKITSEFWTGLINEILQY